MAKPSPAVLNLAVIALLIGVAAADTSSPAAYTNHTVGATTGWFFNATTNTSSADYSKWASDQSFNLGDFLIFKTNSNQTVIQTYNETTFRSCITDDALDSDTFEYDGGNAIGEALTVPVPLTVEGPNYYFSDADDGAQCAQGMAFEIVVKHGLGLPPSLNQPPPPPYVEPPPSDSNQTTPTSTDQQQTFYRAGSARGANVRTGVFLFLLCGFWVLV
ncbi:hypothetical protein HHK36_027846 [Tetracentron sinense]|uniref:Phytocyanin domain-containing protein n=1 Tax=Tetracentron sinense TaxID=13715 RepID=A0A834YDW9_TETSI|nr:hypothetical protein HHK36_027846 [Tetracentron sinense]